MVNDYKILRELANRYFEIANSDINRENILLHKKVNDLKGSRPIVLIDEIPWHEMNVDGELDLLCESKLCRDIEWHFKSCLYKWKHMRADMVLPNYYAVRKIVNSTGIGVKAAEEEHNKNTKVVRFIDQFVNDDDLLKLRNDMITYDEQSTKDTFHTVANIFGDILPVKITGQESGYSLGCKTWDDIVRFKGLETLFSDLVEREDFMHKLVNRLTDIYIDKIKQYDELGLFDGDAYYNHCASALTNDLKPDHSNVRVKDVWGRGMAQIFASVSPQMHDEYDIKYMIKAMEPFGLVYYGCCEPLDKKIRILEDIPNLRKISITPWADINKAAEIIRNKYVISAKPNPASLSERNLDSVFAKKELSEIVNACVRNNCSCDIVLKDITTVGGDPRNLFEWERIAMETVLNV